MPDAHNTPDLMGGDEKPALPAHIADALAAEETPSEVKERIEKAEAKPAEDDLAEKDRKRMARAYTFHFEYPPEKGRRPDERVYRGTFTNSFANVRLRRRIGIARAELSGGIPFDVLDPFTRELALIVSHLTWTLDVDANTKDHWSRDLEGLDDYEVLQALYAEVVLHENTFLRRG